MFFFVNYPMLLFVENLIFILYGLVLVNKLLCWCGKILCREPHMDEAIYNQLVEKATSEGYDVSKLHRTPQSDNPPEAEESPQDTKGIWWIKSIFGK